MCEQSNGNTNTVIEDRINDILSGESQKNALDFVSFMKTNNITPKIHEESGGWSIMRADEDIGFMIADNSGNMPGPWTVWFNSCDFKEDGPVDDDVKETAWEHASICGNFLSGGKDCGCGDQPGFHRVIFGKEFENRCHSPLMFVDPDANTLENMKKLMLMLK